MSTSKNIPFDFEPSANLWLNLSDIESLPMPLVVWSQQQEILSWNSAAQSLFGFSAQEAIGQTLSQCLMQSFCEPDRKLFFMENKKALLEKHWNDISQRAKQLKCTGECTDQQGQRRLCDWFSFPLASIDDKTPVYASIIQDRTEEESLRCFEQMFKVASSRLADCIWMIDSKGQLIAATEKGAQLLGYTLEEYLSLNITNLSPEISLKDYPLHFAELKKSGSFTFETPLLHKNGQKVLVEGTAQHFQAHENEFNIGFAIHPQTFDRSKAALEKSQTELKEQIRLTRKYAEEANLANLAKDIFIASMSHEIHTPLSCIIGFSQHLSQSAPKEMQSPLATITSSAENLLAIMSDILDLSSIGAGQFQIHEVIACPKLILEEVSRIFKSRAQNKGLDLKVHFAEDFPDFFRLDALRLRQILSNLISNAIKYTAQGSVQVYAKSEENTSLKVRSHDLMFIIEDTGIGVPVALAEKIFEPFFQIQSSERSEGVGLGLGISRQLAQKMGGDIYLTHLPKGGSRFTLHLWQVPVANNKTTSDNKNTLPSQEVDMSFPQARILVVDSHASNRQLLQFMLHDRVGEIFFAENTLVALEQIEDHKPHLILLDARMPFVDSFTFLEKLQESSDKKHIPVLALSASVLPQDEAKAKNYVNFAFLKKPFGEKELFCAMAQQLSAFVEVQKHSATNKALVPTSLPQSTHSAQSLLILWEKVQSPLIFDQVRDFQKDVEVFASQNDFIELLTWARELASHLSSYHLPRIKDCLALFPTHIPKSSQQHSNE